MDYWRLQCSVLSESGVALLFIEVIGRHWTDVNLCLKVLEKF